MAIKKWISHTLVTILTLICIALVGVVVMMFFARLDKSSIKNNTSEITEKQLFGKTVQSEPVTQHEIDIINNSLQNR